MSEEDIPEIIGPESYQSSDQKLSFQTIVMQHLKKITIISSQEFHGGYWKTHTGNKEANILINTYIPDTRQMYINAVEVLADILSPHYDNPMISKEKEINGDLEEIRKKMNDHKKLSQEQKNTKFSMKKRKNRQELFRALNSFLSREDYMKSVSYTGHV